ncbi:SpoIIE family protein phosphatase [Solirubrobacter taibaiensis]|nr:SpoIIE family protein phosphatase [Solirubrobacter taibaiensis]
MRTDAAHNADRILESTMTLLRTEPEASLEEIAAAAEVSRATVYRHFGSRAELVRIARRRSDESADANQTDALRPAGELAGGPTPLDVTEVLNKVPPHLLGDQIVSEARRLAGVTSVALYLIDLEGTHLLRLAGSEEFPETLDLPLAVGPELPREGLVALRRQIADELPGSVLAPLSLRGRTLGILLAVDAPEHALVALARQAAASLALADAYTDVFDIARRRKETSPAAEIQQNLLPPRIARITGALVAGNVLPGYEIGGDWFDYVENRDGAWLGVADSMGSGTTAAALGAVSLGAFRAKRKVTGDLVETVLAIHRTIREVAVEGAFVNATIGRWHGPSSSFSWITCGEQRPLLINERGQLSALEGPTYDSLGVGPAKRTFVVSRRRLAPGERLLLVSDGVLGRRTHDGGTFGTDGVRAAVRGAADAAPAETVRALEDAIMAVSADRLEDDATIVVLAPTSRR